jgi:FkbM family methyltransferase
MKKLNHIIKQIMPLSWYYQYLSISRKIFSQFGQDIWVYGEVFNKQKNGFFVEIGSADGLTFSNTFLLESKFNWDGICIEANPNLFKNLKKYRKVNCLNVCVDEKVGEVQYELNWLNSGIISDNTDNKTMNSNQNISLKTETLFSILESHSAPKIIDYLSIDVEGAEERILRNFSFNLYRFNCITIERPTNYLREILKENGYIIIKEIPGLDVFYIHQSYSETYQTNMYKFSLYVTILLLTDLLVIIFCNASVIIWDNI